MVQASALRFSLEASRPSVVMDLSLLLSREGLLMTLLLASGNAVWLPRYLFSFLDDEGLCGELGGTAVQGTVAAWNDARLRLNLNGIEGLYWPHDGEDEAVLPKGIEGGFVARMDAFAAGLEWRSRQKGRDGAAAANECFGLHHHLIEVLALTATLWRERAILLTLAEGGKPPAVIAELERAGIMAPKIKAKTASLMQGASLRPLLAETGVAAHALSAGLHLAAVHLCVPYAPLAIRHAAGDEEDFWDADLEMPTSEGETLLAALWEGASAFWYELS